MNGSSTLIGETPLGRVLPVGLQPRADTAKKQCSLNPFTSWMKLSPRHLRRYSSSSASIWSKFSLSNLPCSRGMWRVEQGPNRT